jgi:hypothetical protein
MHSKRIELNLVIFLLLILYLTIKWTVIRKHIIIYISITLNLIHMEVTLVKSGKLLASLISYRESLLELVVIENLLTYLNGSKLRLHYILI